MKGGCVFYSYFLGECPPERVSVKPRGLENGMMAFLCVDGRSVCIVLSIPS